MLARGEFLVVCSENSQGFLVPNWREVVRMFISHEDSFRAKPLLGPPRSHCVTALDVERLISGSDAGHAHAVAFIEGVACP